MSRLKVPSLLGAALLTLLPSSRAALLTGAYESQLETWLGQGDLAFTSIFTSLAGDGQTSFDFHAAVDGRGPTFSLLKVRASGGTGLSSNLPEQIIGGYNPQSWNTSGIGVTPTDPERTAFLFNLTSTEIQRQNLIGQGNPGSGQAQTVNVTNQGPSFGGGDIFVQSNLHIGYAFNWSYGGTSLVDPITFGGVDSQLYWDDFRIYAIEVFAFAPAPSSGVPDTGSNFLMVASGLLGLLGLRRRFAR